MQDKVVDQASQSNSILYHRQEEPRVFSDQYQKLRDYVSNSLDMYKVVLPLSQASSH